MAGPLGVIAGHYFDPEKNKYFKLEKNAVPETAQAKYTHANVKKVQKRNREELRKQERLERTERETIVRPHTHKGWGIELAGLEREVGVRRKSYYTHSVWPGACVSGMGPMRKVVEQPAHGKIQFFDRDPNTKTLYAVHGDNSIRRRRWNPLHGTSHAITGLENDTAAVSLSNSRLSRMPVTEVRNEYSFEPWDSLNRLTSSISSLTYLPTSRTLAATTFGTGGHSPVVYFADPDIDGPGVNLQFRMDNCNTIRDAAIPPFKCAPNSIPQADTERLAIAASSTLRLFYRSPEAGDWESKTAAQARQNIMSLDWLSTTTIAIGERNGTISTYDTRSGQLEKRLTHPYPIVKLKRADDESRIICAGMQDTLFLYDLRASKTGKKFSRDEPGHYNDRFFNSQYPGPQNYKKRKTMKNTTAGDWSQPVLSFPYTNADDGYLDIAVEPELGLVAAAQDFHSRVALKVYNMWTGKPLLEIPKNNSGEATIRCLKFMQDVNGAPELWSTWDGEIVKISLT